MTADPELSHKLERRLQIMESFDKVESDTAQKMGPVDEGQLNIHHQSSDASDSGYECSESEAPPVKTVSHIDEIVTKRMMERRASATPSISSELAEKLAHRIARSESLDTEDLSRTELETNIILLSKKQNPPEVVSPNISVSEDDKSTCSEETGGATAPVQPLKKNKRVSISTDFSRKELKRLKEAFIKYDFDCDNFIGFDDLKLMMEKLGIPQTHLALKSLIKEVDEDLDSKINFREFLSIFKKARAGELDYCSEELLAWFEVYVDVPEIDVDEVGVLEAKKFFESKIAILTMGSQFEQEIRDEQERQRREEEEKRLRAEEFKSKRSLFS